MSWYSDHEPFDEYELKGCDYCNFRKNRIPSICEKCEFNFIDWEEVLEEEED